MNLYKITKLQARENQVQIMAIGLFIPMSAKKKWADSSNKGEEF